MADNPKQELPGLPDCFTCDKDGQPVANTGKVTGGTYVKSGATGLISQLKVVTASEAAAHPDGFYINVIGPKKLMPTKLQLVPVKAARICQNPKCQHPGGMIPHGDRPRPLVPGGPTVGCSQCWRAVKDTWLKPEKQAKNAGGRKVAKHAAKAAADDEEQEDVAAPIAAPPPPDRARRAAAVAAVATAAAAEVALGHQVREDAEEAAAEQRGEDVGMYDPSPAAGADEEEGGGSPLKRRRRRNVPADSGDCSCS